MLHRMLYYLRTHVYFFKIVDQCFLKELSQKVLKVNLLDNIYHESYKIEHRLLLKGDMLKILACPSDI
jgi:hypothetical protein